VNGGNICQNEFWNFIQNCDVNAIDLKLTVHKSTIEQYWKRPSIWIFWSNFEWTLSSLICINNFIIIIIYTYSGQMFK
jgi:hypothetical protein